MTHPRALILLAALLLQACHFSPMAMLAPHTRVDVQEVWRSQYCNAPDGNFRATLFEGADGVRAFAAQRQLQLPESLRLEARPHALVEQGQRPTAGYGMAVSRDALIRGDRVIELHATFMQPSADRMRAQVITSPCALVQLPPGRYKGVLVYDQRDKVVADSTVDPAESSSWLPWQ